MDPVTVAVCIAAGVYTVNSITDKFSVKGVLSRFDKPPTPTVTQPTAQAIKPQGKSKKNRHNGPAK